MRKSYLRDLLQKGQEEAKNFISGVHGPSFTGGAVVGSATGAALTVLVRRMNEDGKLDAIMTPIHDFIERVKDGDGTDVIETEANVIDVEPVKSSSVTSGGEKNVK